MRFSMLLATAVLAGTATVATNAHADPNPGVDWMRVLLDLDAVGRKGADAFESPRCTAAGCFEHPAPLRIDRSTDLNVHNAGNAWFGIAPRLSLVARDWGTAYRVAGDRLSVVDAMRLTSSTRMVVSRVRLSDRNITPFAQVGLGQWRTDPNLLPLTPRYTEIAAQMGGGFEIRLLPWWQVAAESTVTVLHREGIQADGIPVPRMWSAMIASRIEF